MQNTADELKLKLKEKETMLRIAKFKLTEVNRNIKYGQLHVSQADKAAKKEEAAKPASIKKEVKGGVTYNIQK